MKRVFLSAAVFAGFLAGGMPLAYAEPALVIQASTQLCVVVLPNGTASAPSSKGIYVATHSNNVSLQQDSYGNEMAKCHVTVDPPSDGQAVHLDYDVIPVQCAILNTSDSQLTTNWDETISASGQATLTCRLP